MENTQTEAANDAALTEGEAACLAAGINVTLLRQVAAAILAYPKSFRMESFFEDSFQDIGPSIFDVDANPKKLLEQECGTSACIAGWTVILTAGRTVDANNVHGWAATELGLNDDQCQLLFYQGWPEPFDSQYDDARDMDNYALAAEVAARRIEHFIQTGGAE